MKTFCVETLGCKVNHYESEQLASLLRARGLVETAADRADLRIINTCSVTVQAASQSRQSVRRMVRLPVLSDVSSPLAQSQDPTAAGADATSVGLGHPSLNKSDGSAYRPRVIVTGCWATSDKPAASALAGVDAVLTHHQDVAAELDRLLALWQVPQDENHASPARPHARAFGPPPQAMSDDGWMMKAGSAAGNCTTDTKPKSVKNVNENSVADYSKSAREPGPIGANSLPLLGDHQTGRQRAFLKVQDGCDAHCTYCIIPQLRPSLFSKPIEDAVEEARRLVASGHVEIILTGIFLGAYGQPTALRRYQTDRPAAPLARLVEALCEKVSGLRRLRLSSLEPGDLTDDLLGVLASQEKVVPHFHLPLQSGSDELLRRMNRQYRREDFLQMVDRVRAAFDRPAFTTDIIVGFPGETDGEFGRTLDVVERAKFIHIHAFPYSPRPGTAAARWKDQFVHGPVVNQRIDELGRLADGHSLAFRSQFVGRAVEVIVEAGAGELRHGRCERYFPVFFDAPKARPGDVVRVRIDRVTPARTFGAVCDLELAVPHRIAP